MLQLWGCGSDKSEVDYPHADPDDTGTSDSGEPEGDDTCLPSCLDRKLEAFQVNTVVLENKDTGLTQPGSFAGCDPLDTADDEAAWPCLMSESLNLNFLEDQTPFDDRAICFDQGRTSTCIKFVYSSHLDYAAVSALPHSGDDCASLIDLGDDPVTDTGFSGWAAHLKEAARQCDDKLIFDPLKANIYIIDNPWGSNSSFNGWGGTKGDTICGPVTFIDKDRFPPDIVEPYRFETAVNEHEMGHGFGLGHHCAEHIPTTNGTPTNIMQTNAENCCQESSTALQDGGKYPEFAPGTYWDTNLANDCSVTDTGTWDTGAPYTPPTDCGLCDTGDPGYPSCTSEELTYNENSDCAVGNSQFSVGDRQDKFTNDAYYPVDTGSPAVGQIDRILQVALDRCSCACNYRLERRITRITPKAEPLCSAGTGRFALLLYRVQDRDHDDAGFGELVPVQISGNPLGKLSWITSVDFVGFGDFTTIAVPTAGHDFVFSSSDPDDLITTNMAVFDSTNDDATFSLGTVATGYPWAVEGLDLEETTYDWPVVDLVWGCNNDYEAPDVYKQARPPNAYILPVADLVGDWEQELLLRPDLPALRLWVEVRGNPRFASWVPLTDAGGYQYDWAFSGFGLAMSGWIKKVGSPVGAKLRVHVDEGSYQDTTWSNLTLSDLDKVP